MTTDFWKIFDKVVKHKQIRRILLHGKPGTGKTTKACNSAGKNGFYNITLTEESSVADILGFWMPKGKKFKFNPGLGIKAWEEDKTLVINEIDKASGSVLTVLHAILDDKKIAKYTLPDGRTVRPGKHFKAIATMNGSVQELPEALADRFDLKLDIKKPCQEAVDSLPEDLRPLVDAAYSKETLSITFREIQAFAKLRNIIEDDAYIVFGAVANDVKSTLKLGERPKESNMSSSSTLQADTDRALRQLNRYWNKTEYEDLDSSILKSFAFKLVPSEEYDGIKGKIDTAFGVKSFGSTFKSYIDAVYNDIVRLASKTIEEKSPLEHIFGTPRQPAEKYETVDEEDDEEE